MPFGKGVSAGTVIIGAILLAAVGMTAYLRTTPAHRAIPADLQGVLRPAPKALHTFSLSGPQGQRVTLDRLKGRWTMLFFGYTYCPDICPTTLATLSTVFQGLQTHPEVISDTQVLFVSVDPQRDRPEKLAEYVAYFDKRFTAATGAVEDIDGLAQQIGAGYQFEPGDASGNYLVAHTASIFLVDPQARLVGSFPFPHTPDTIIGQYLRIREL